MKNIANTNRYTNPSSLYKPSALVIAVLSGLLLTACHDDNNKDKTDKTTIPSEKTPKDPTKKSPLLGEPVLVNTFDTNALKNLSITLTPPKCDVKVKKFTYQTQGAGGELTTATSALMLPYGGDGCNNERPVLLYAHGTTTEKSYDLSQVDAKNPASWNANALAANYAAQGYIVIAPNYAGYDQSTLDYHPYLNKKQQSADMYDALKAGRQIVKDESNISTSDKLFISGYSQGGFVAMATAQHLQNVGETVTAVAPMSGPYAMTAFGDAIFGGQVNQGATIFAPLVAVNYQKQYQNIYNAPNDIFTDKYANGIETAIPGEYSWEGLANAGKIPSYALFQSNTGIAQLDQLPKSHPIFFDDKDYLVKTDYRLQYLTDMKKHPDGLFANNGKATDAMPVKNTEHPFRQALKDNDLRGYVPTMPVFLCGGNQDPMVFFDVNTTAMAGIWKQMSQLNSDLDITVLDVDTSNANDRKGMETLQFIGKANDNKRNMDKIGKQVQTQFNMDMKKIIDSSGKLAMIVRYHGSLTGTACEIATSQYFSQF